MHGHRRQLMMISIATLAFACLLLITSLISFKPLVLFFIIFLLALSLVTDSIVLHMLFQKQEGLIQLIRGFCLLSCFVILIIHFLLKAF